LSREGEVVVREAKPLFDSPLKGRGKRLKRGAKPLSYLHPPFPYYREVLLSLLFGASAPLFVLFDLGQF